MFRLFIFLLYLGSSVSLAADESFDGLSVDELTQLGRSAQREGDIETAQYYYRGALEKGAAPRALANLGQLYFLGHGVPKDAERGMAMMREAAETGHPAAMTILATRLGGRNQTEAQNAEARDLLERAANAGNAQAMGVLAEAFHRGVGIPSDPLEADAVRQNGRDLLQQAADAGDDGAMLALARIYMLGIQVPTDFIKAEQLLLAGAKPENIVTRRYLGSLYLDHLERPEDAYRVYRALADEGDHGGMNHLYRMFYNGIGVEQDYTEAAYWALESAKQGGPLAGFRITGYASTNPSPAPTEYIRAVQVLLQNEGHYSGPLDGEETDEFEQILLQYLAENTVAR